MPTAREQLIGDWRKRLAATSDVPAESSPRSAWLARVRARLYRFLLSLYGDGQWRASQPALSDEKQTCDSGPTGDTFMPLDGKPAKEAGIIRAALKSFANARERPNEAGPLAAGLGGEAWTTVASLNNDIEPQSCADALASVGIPSRLVARRGDVTVEVRVMHEPAAIKLIGSRIERLRCFKTRLVPMQPDVLEVAIATLVRWIRQIPPWWRFIFVSAFHLLLTFPLAWICVTIFSTAESTTGERLPAWHPTIIEQFWTIWRGFLVIALLLVWLRADRMSRKQKDTRRAKLPSIVTR